MSLASDSISRRLWLAAALLTLVSVGCSHTPTADEQIDAMLKAQGASRVPVYPLGGKVTINGSAPAPHSDPVVVILYDPSKPEDSSTQRPHITVDDQGKFAFATYKEGDGMPAGKYVVLFAQFKYSKRRGLMGPDQLKNLYNDPDKNAQDSQFVIQHQAPGKSDYSFDLKVDSKASAAAPGAHAVTDLSDTGLTTKRK